MTDPVAFMVMPFLKKPTGRSGDRIPETVDFDSLWYRVHKPVLEAMGYRAVRADCDIGALVITEMIQRLTAADLVLADISLANANVFYEVGVRHAAQARGCVLVAAEWAEPVFDLAQMRRLQYPLPDGDVGDEAARQAKERLRTALPPLVDGISPVFQAVPGYPGGVDLSRMPLFEDVVETLSGFAAEVEAIRETPGEAARKERTQRLLASQGHKAVVRESVVLELLQLVRDNLGWEAVAAYVDGLPDRLRRHPLVTEQKLLAQGKGGDPAGAVGALKQLIKEVGATSERQGLLGGRYKELMRQTGDPVERRRYLDLAIEAYERGMTLDLNDFYPTSNLPRLYRRRAMEGDQQRAVVAATVTVAASSRRIALGKDDEWTRTTLLGAAFDRGDVAAVKELLPEIRREGAVRWRLETTIKDLVESLDLQEDPGIKKELADVLDSLRALIPGGT